MSALEKLFEKQCPPSKAGVLIKDTQNRILTGYNGEWLTDICFHPPSKDGVKKRSIDYVVNKYILGDGKDKTANNIFHEDIANRIINLDDKKVDDGSDEAKIINEYLNELNQDQFKDLCRVCYRYSDNESFDSFRGQLPDLSDDEIDKLLQCKKTHIGKIIFNTVEKIEGFNFKLDIIKGSLERGESTMDAMLRELSEEIMFTDIDGTLLDKNYVLDTLKTNFRIFNELEDSKFNNLKIKIYETTTKLLNDIGLFPQTIDDIEEEVNYKSELYQVKFRSLDDLEPLSRLQSKSELNSVLRAVYEKYRPSEEGAYAKVSEEGANAKVSEEGTSPRAQVQPNIRRGPSRFYNSKKPGDNLKKGGYKDKYMKYKLKYLNLKKKIENIN